MEDTVKLEEKPEAPKKIKEPVIRSVKLAEADFEITESMQPFYTAVPPAGTTREDLKNPMFWSHVAKRLRTMSEIRVMPKDGSWYGVYLVTFCDEIQVKVHELDFHKLGKVETLENAKCEIKWVSPADGVKWCVVRKEDKFRLSAGHETQESAHNWMRDNVR